MRIWSKIRILLFRIFWEFWIIRILLFRIFREFWIIRNLLFRIFFSKF